MYKECIRICLFLCITLLCSGFAPLKQIVLPLSHGSGVPFVLEDDGIYIDGFAVDADENLYFSGGGEETYIYGYSSKSRKSLFRKRLTQTTAGSLFIQGDRLYMLSHREIGNYVRIVQLDKRTGATLRNVTYDMPSHLSVNRSIFLREGLSVWFLEKVDAEDEEEHLLDEFVLFDLSGKRVKTMDNIYNLKPQVLSTDSKLVDAELIGRYRGNYVFYNIEDFDYCTLYLVNENGVILKSAHLPFETIGAIFNAASMGNSEDHKVIQNGKLYILGIKEDNLVISEYALRDLFI